MKPPLIQAEGDWFSMTFMRKGPHDAIETLRDKGKGFIPSEGGVVEGVNEGMDEGISEGINGGVNALLEFIRNAPGLRKPQISRALGIPVRTLQRQLRILRNQNRIEFKGGPKTGGYHAKESEVGPVMAQ
jgi:hypothetical protein